MAEEFPPRPQRPAWISVIWILMTAFIGFAVIGPLVGFFLALPLWEGSGLDLATALTSNDLNQSIVAPYYVMQACATFIGLVVGPWLLFRIQEQASVTTLVKPVSVRLAIQVMVLVVVFIILDSVVVYWNSNLHFPDGFDQWVRSVEAKAEQLTKLLTNFSGPGQFAAALLVIAVLPALGEELVFRGMLQPQLQRWSGNAHVAIWTAAIIFSAFHMQFLGFVPRVLLGALFGYLYYWSGNLLVPIIAHFTNNGLAVLLIYLNQLGVSNIDAESNEPAPVMLLIASAFGAAFLLSYLRRNLSTPIT